MQLRAIALAMPLVLGTACKSSGTPAPTTATALTEAGAQASTADVTRHPVEPSAPAVASDADLKRHPDDLIAAGRVSQVSPESIAIRTEQGVTTLQLAPETVVIVNGAYGRLSSLQEGQEVRASYAQVEGREVAQKIAVAPAPAPKPDAADQGGSGMPAPQQPR